MMDPKTQVQTQMRTWGTLQNSKTKPYLRTAQARPSGFLPALIFPVTDRDFRSMTTM